MGNRSNFLIIGHRGVPSLAQENSASSFKKAVELSLPMVEFDARITKDNKLVVIHDLNIKHLSNGNAKVHDSTLKYLKKFNYANSFHKKSFERILTLEEAISILLPKVKLMLEIKENQNKHIEITKALVAIITKKKIPYSMFIVSSFSEKLLIEIQKIDPKIRLGFLFKNKPKTNTKKAIKNQFHSIHPHSSIARQCLIVSKLKRYVWTVNNPLEVAKWKRLKFDGVITDCPEKVLKSS